MGRSKKLKNLFSIYKDKAILIKLATLSINHNTTSTIQIAVLRATTRTPLSPPPDHRISALLSLGHTTRHSAYACVHATIHRLHHHHGKSVYVALKSLITLHNMITRGSLFLKEQLSFYPNSGSLSNFLNLSRFVDKTDTQTREFSTWVRWYAGVLERNLSACRVLGCFLSSSKFEIEKNKETLKSSLMMDLFEEMDVLVSAIEEICRAPESLYCQTNDIVYEVMRLVGEDYRMTQYHTMIRLGELKGRIRGFSEGELDELTRCLVRLEGCRGRLTDLFVNRKRNDAFWESVSEMMAELARAKEDRETKSASQKMIVHASELTQLRKQLRAANQRLRMLPHSEVNNWLSIDRVSMASA